MNKKRTLKVSLISTVIHTLFIAEFIASGRAYENMEIPDHRTFQSCRECHAEQHDMWEASNHGKEIREMTQKNPAATDCNGCHSPKRSTYQGSAVTGVSKEAFHKTSCLACHNRQNGQYEH